MCPLFLRRKIGVIPWDSHKGLCSGNPICLGCTCCLYFQAEALLASRDSFIQQHLLAGFLARK